MIRRGVNRFDRLAVSDRPAALALGRTRHLLLCLFLIPREDREDVVGRNLFDMLSHDSAVLVVTIAGPESDGGAFRHSFVVAYREALVQIHSRP